MADWEMKTFDTYPPLGPVTLTDSNGVINLTNATSVKFIAKGQKSPGGVTITGTCTIVNAAQGVVQYSWGSTDTQVADTYLVEFEIHWVSGGVQTVPNQVANNKVLLIDQDLEGS